MISRNSSRFVFFLRQLYSMSVNVSCFINRTTAWLTEQTLREIYLRPFELALKGAEKTVA